MRLLFKYESSYVLCKLYAVTQCVKYIWDVSIHLSVKPEHATDSIKENVSSHTENSM